MLGLKQQPSPVRLAYLPGTSVSCPKVRDNTCHVYLIQKGGHMSDEPIPVGHVAPDFSLPASSGRTPLVLSDLRGQIVVLAFYVLDFTET